MLKLTGVGCVLLLGLAAISPLSAQGYTIRPLQPFTVSAAHSGDGIEHGGWRRLKLDGKEYCHVGLSGLQNDGYVHFFVAVGLSAGIHTAIIDACNEVTVGNVKCRSSAALKLCVRADSDAPCPPAWLIVTAP